MLRRLLREALFHSHKPRRHHAALLIATSPYAPAARDTCWRSLPTATTCSPLAPGRY